MITLLLMLKNVWGYLVWLKLLSESDSSLWWSIKWIFLTQQSKRKRQLSPSANFWKSRWPKSESWCTGALPHPGSAFLKTHLIRRQRTFKINAMAIHRQQHTNLVELTNFDSKQKRQELPRSSWLPHWSQEQEMVVLSVTSSSFFVKKRCTTNCKSFMSVLLSRFLDVAGENYKSVEETSGSVLAGIRCDSNIC